MGSELFFNLKQTFKYLIIYWKKGRRLKVGVQILTNGRLIFLFLLLFLEEDIL